MVEKRRRKLSLKITQFSGAVAGAGGSPEKKEEYSVKSTGIFLTAVDGIWLDLTEYSVSLTEYS